MNLEKILNQYHAQTHLPPQESKIQETITQSIDAFCAAEQSRTLSRREFLWTQAGLIHKRWWLLQLLLLTAAGLALPSIEETFLLRRSMGVAGALFVILMIPELWKNRSLGCMEIEAAAYYSLRQIYAARLFLFGLADLVLLTGFLGILGRYELLTPQLLISQFLLPLAVTACICFGLLCSQRHVSESFSLVLCSIFSALWWLITANERLYSAVTLPVWCALLALALLLLSAAVYRTLKTCSLYWEMSVHAMER
ncbi:MAG: hypothetical protein HFI75_14490 [Lachnospiraceae bacterium]|nr:hypothetical protein [Lachnospiraceae bacterium]